MSTQAKPKGTPVAPVKPPTQGTIWSPMGGLTASKPKTGPRVIIAKGGKKSKVRRSSRRRHHRQNRTQRRN
jgi:hypothetical protein